MCPLTVWGLYYVEMEDTDADAHMEFDLISEYFLHMTECVLPKKPHTQPWISVVVYAQHRFQVHQTESSHSNLVLSL